MRVSAAALPHYPPPNTARPGPGPHVPSLYGLGYNPASSAFPPLAFPRSPPSSGLLGAGLPLSLCGVAIKGEPALLCGFLPPSLLSLPGPGDSRPGEGAPRGCPRRAFRRAPPTTTLPSCLPPGCLRVGPGGDVTLPLA